MKGDVTRRTFDRKKHYDRVLQQQGRVSIDADDNEAADLAAYRLESTAADVIGPSGAPLDNAGFAITVPSPGSGELVIGAGHYYVDGILVENDQAVPPVLYSNQPHLSGLPTTHADGDYIAYLEVWKRHIAAIEDPDIRETALGGPDTATRSQVIWQVKLHQLPASLAGANCDIPVPSFDALIAPSSGTMAARAQPSTASTVCVLPPTAGYRRLENQLYRVEILDASNPGAVSFVWSRDNGSIAVAGKFVNNQNDRLNLVQPGRDALRGFTAGVWVELSTDASELSFTPGILVRLKSVDGSEATLDLATATAPVIATAFPSGVKVRRWDSPGPVLLSSADPAVNDGYLQLEEGVQVIFTGTGFHNGDYWEIPARTPLGDILWPTVEQSGGPVPLSLAPHGVRRHYARLAMVHFQSNAVTEIKDCRHLFPPLTRLTGLFYVCGDGQQATPNVSTPTALLPLPHSLQAGVANGGVRVAGRFVQFQVTAGNGRVGGLTTVAVPTDSDGVATCNWSIDSVTPLQTVEARLLDGVGQPIHLPVRYEATLNTADKVSYNPQACSNLAGAFTVQAALDRLCKLGHGGCCVTVGEGGEYPTLKSALDNLLEKRHVCICLLAGTHLIEETIEVVPKVRGTVVHIRGCGNSSIVQGKKASIIFRSERLGLEQVHLEDFALLLQNGSVQFQQVGEVTCTQLRYSAEADIASAVFTGVTMATIDNCAINNTAPATVLRFKNVETIRMWHSQITGMTNLQMQPLVLVDGASDVSLEHNLIDGYVKGEGDPREMKPDFDPATQRFVADYKALTYDDLTPFSATWTASIPTATAERQRLARAVGAAAGDSRAKLSDLERYYYSALGTTLSLAAPTGAAMLAYLKGLRLAAQVDGNICALALSGISARLELTGNTLNGITVLYGLGPALVTQEMFAEGAKNKLIFGTMWPVLDAVIQGNDFGVITVDRAFWNAVVKDKTVPVGTFRNLAFTNNRAHGAAQILVAGYVSLTGNFFLQVPGFNGGAIGRSTLFAGNQSQIGWNDISRFNCAAQPNQTPAYLNDANHMLIIGL